MRRHPNTVRFPLGENAGIKIGPISVIGEDKFITFDATSTLDLNNVSQLSFWTEGGPISTSVYEVKVTCYYECVAQDTWASVVQSAPTVYDPRGIEEEQSWWAAARSSMDSLIQWGVSASPSAKATRKLLTSYAENYIGGSLGMAPRSGYFVEDG
jgi:hypothetical protein